MIKNLVETYFIYYINGTYYRIGTFGKQSYIQLERLYKKIAGVNKINIIHRYDEFLENFFKIQEIRRRFWTEFLTVYKKSGGRRDFYRLYSLGPECRKRISKSYRY